MIEVGREMCENTAIKKVSFTGSTPVAKMLYGLASTTMKKCVDCLFRIHADQVVKKGVH